MGFKPTKHMTNPKAKFDKREGILTIYLDRVHSEALAKGQKVEYGSLTPREVTKVIIVRDR